MIDFDFIYFEEENQNRIVKIPKKKKGFERTSWHRDEKTGVHSTINGIGTVGRLFRKSPIKCR